LQDDSALPKLSVRIKLLIKNLLENRQHGWQRSLQIEENGPMKVEDLR
jgi:hypothetical protein